MSKVVKGVGKVVKGVGKAIGGIAKFVKKNFKWIALGVAAYFTAGVALSYFGATSGIAASMPGFGAGGIFTKTASFMGLSGPAKAAAAATAKVAGAGGITATGVAGSQGIGAAVTSGVTGGATTAAGSGAFVMPGKVAAGAAGAGAAGAGAGAAGAGAGAAGAAGAGAAGAAGSAAATGGAVKAVGGLFSDPLSKLMLAKTVLDVGAAAFTNPHRKYMFGVNRKGEGPGMIADNVFEGVRTPDFTPGGDFDFANGGSNNDSGNFVGA